MIVFNFNNKFETLKRYISKGEIINTKIIKKVSSTRATANIKGYNVIIQGDNLPAENEQALFYVKDFNQKEQTIILKSIKIPQNLFTDTKLYKFISLQLKKYNFPVNLTTIRITFLLYRHFGNISKDLLNKFIMLLKINNDPDFVFSLFKLNLPDNLIAQILKNFNNLFSTIYGLSEEAVKHIKKNKVADKKINEKNKRVWYNISRNSSIDVLLNSNDIKVKNRAIGWKFFNLLNYIDKNNYIRIIPILDGYNIVPIKVHYKRTKKKDDGEDIIFFRLDIPIDNKKIIYSIEVLNEKFMYIRIMSDSNEIIYHISREINELKKRLSKINKFSVSIILDDSEQNLDVDIYI